MVDAFINADRLIQQGAEAKVYKCDFLGREAVAKIRFSKKYRHPELDEKLTHKRMSQEARAIQRCLKIGVNVPAIYFVDMDHNVIVLEYIDSSITFKEYIFTSEKKSPPQEKDSLISIMETVGQCLAKMHDSDIIHGDLTTSNILVKTVCENAHTKSEVFFIDFGLSTSSRLAEDKGVDLYVLEKAFLSTHPNSEKLFETLINSYKLHSKNCKQVISKFEEVKMRGRKRTMVG